MSLESLIGKDSKDDYHVIAGTKADFELYKDVTYNPPYIFLQISKNENFIKIEGIKIADGFNALKDLPFVNWYNCFAKENRLIINKQEFNKEE